MAIRETANEEKSKLMRTSRRMLACSMLAVLCVVGSGASLASATPAQLHRNVYFPSNANHHDGSHGDRVCALTGGAATKDVELATGWYLWESYERMLNRTPSGDYYTIHRAQRTIELRAGTYRWSSCLHYSNPPGCTSPGGCAGWSNRSQLIELATGGSAFVTSYPPDSGPYEYITRIGSNLWQCSTESVC